MCMQISNYFCAIFYLVYIYFKYLKNLSSTRHRAKLRREVTPYMKIIKMLIKLLLFQNILPNLDILSVYILFNSVYV